MTDEYVTYNGTPSCESKRMKDIHDKIIPPNPGNVIPELSPDWDFDLGMLRSNSKPVGMFESESSNPGVVAKKWVVKD